MRRPPRATLLSCVLAIGCAHLARSPIARFDEAGFHADADAYSIGYAQPEAWRLLSDAWQVDNYSYKRGRPAREKTEGEYDAKLSWPASDGRLFSVSTTAYDLRLSHRESNGVIWVRAMPVPAELRGKRLRVLAEDWANRLTGTLYQSQLVATERSNRLATKLLESRTVRVGDRPGHAVTFEVVDLDKRELDPDAPGTRVRALFVSASLRKHLESLSPGYGDFDAPACLLLGYANDDAEFDESLADFERLVAAVRFADER
jgi:hypothetical protein